jgi:ABC-type Zn uptake system ZnuABC Zn-binding protein ZnuA
MKDSQKQKIETEFDKRSIPGLLIFFLLLVVGLGLFFYWRSKREETETETPEKIVVTATIFPIYDITRNVVGNDDSFEVVQIVPSGEDPNSYQLSVDSLQLASDPRIVFKIGVGLDDWIDSGYSGVDIVDLSQEVELMEVERNGIEVDSPYYWLSIENAKLISEKIFEELAALRPESEGVLRTNLEEYLGELDNTSSQLTVDPSTTLRTGSLQLVSYRDNLAYLAEENGIEILATFEDYVGQEVSTEYLTELEQLMDENDISVIYVDSFTDEEVVQNLVWDKVVEVKAYNIYNGESEDSSYIDMIRNLINQM